MAESPSEKKIRVLLAEDHALVRQGFRRLLEDDPHIEVVGEVSTGIAAIEHCARLRPDVVVMDVSMPELGGLEATAEIRKANSNVKVLILSMYSNPAYVQRAIEVGAKGYILKDTIEVDLAKAVMTLARGEAYMSPAVLNLVMEGLKTDQLQKPVDDPYERLTLREKEVLQLIAQGKSNKEIAALLNISFNTVAAHRARLMETLGLHRTAELVLYAVRKGIVQPH